MQKQGRWPRVRKIFNNIHRWVGLASGLIVVTVCFSGTMYVWNTELTEWANSHLYKVSVIPGAARIPVDSMLPAISQRSSAPVTGLSVSSDPGRSYQYTTRVDTPGSRAITWFVDPYSGKLLGNSMEKSRMRSFTATMFSLHRWLLLDQVKKPILPGISNKDLGAQITGWSAILFTIGCLTGLVIWFPQKIKTWRQGLKIRFDAKWKRVNHDLHNALGLYAFLFLLLMGITGPYFGFTWYRTGVQKTLGTWQPKKTEPVAKSADSSNKLPGDTGSGAAVPGSALERSGFQRLPLQRLPLQHLSLQPLPLQRYLDTADRQLPYAGDYVINFPTATNPAVSVSKFRRGFFAPAAPDRVELEASGARVIKKEIFRDKPFNQRINGSMKAVHMGSVYGTFTKILWFLAVLIGTSLPVTGTLIWLNKTRKRRKPLPGRNQDDLKLSSNASTMARIKPGSGVLPG